MVKIDLSESTVKALETFYRTTYPQLRHPIPSVDRLVRVVLGMQAGEWTDMFARMSSVPYLMSSVVEETRRLVKAYPDASDAEILHLLEEYFQADESYIDKPSYRGMEQTGLKLVGYVRVDLLLMEDRK